MPTMFQTNWQPQMMPATNMALQKNFNNFNMASMGLAQSYPPQNMPPQNYPPQNMMTPQNNFNQPQQNNFNQPQQNNFNQPPIMGMGMGPNGQEGMMME